MTGKRDHASLLAQFDEQERLEAEFPGTEKETLPNLVRFVRPGPGTNFILYSRLDPRTADSVIRTQIEDMQAFEGDLEWKVYRHDLPSDLGTRLEAQGFEGDDPAPVLVLDLAHAPSSLGPFQDIDVKRLELLSELEQVASIEAQVWGGDFSWAPARFAVEMGRPGYLEIFMAYVDGQAASVGWTRYQPTSEFASLWGGATVPTHRKQGLYTAVLAARLEAARRRGRRYVFVEAEPASERILRRYGFYELTTTSSCTWRR